MTDLRTAVASGFDYLLRQDADIPAGVWAKAATLGIFKAEGDLPAVNAAYHDKIAAALLGYFEGGSLAASRNAFKRATVEAFGSAFDMGWKDGGGSPPPDAEALGWLNARVEQEMGYIEMLYQEAKEVKKDPEFDPLPWVSQHADAYTRTIREIYNAAKLRASKDQMVTFEGTDGEKSCDTCKMLKGKRHKISWFVKRNYIPPHGTGLDCAKGGYCQHYLVTDKGERVTL